MQRQVPYGRTHLRALQYDLNHQWTYGDSMETVITLSQQSRVDLHWWTHRPHVMAGVRLGQFTPQVQIMVDASLQQWGAQVVDGSSIHGTWDDRWKLRPINELELQAVHLALLHFTLLCQDKDVLVLSDNTVTTYYINKQGGTRVISLQAIAFHILTWAENHRVNLKARHIPGALNVIADGLSRQDKIISTEWVLDAATLQAVWDKWHRPHIDLFATRFNSRLPIYVSPCPDPHAWAVDAFSFGWQNLDLYAYPPTVLIPKVLRKVREDLACMILIAPMWPSQAWYPDLLRLTVAEPLRLSPHSKLLKQSHNRFFHQDPGKLCLHAWKLLGTRYSTEAFLGT